MAAAQRRLLLAAVGASRRGIAGEAHALHPSYPPPAAAGHQEGEDIAWNFA
jgi:hypothetical protein